MTRAAWILVSLSLAACGTRSPRSVPSAARTCTSSSQAGVSAAATEALGRASNALEYEHAWRDHHAGAATGTVNGAEVQATLRAHGDEIRDCYQTALQNSNESGGRVVVRFVIDEGGRVPNVSLASSELSAPELGCCVVERVAQWSFPKPEAGFVVVEYPFSVRLAR